jgi:rhodanese-related sulfurtransferase
VKDGLYCAMKRNVLEAIGIVFFSILIALCTNHIRSNGIALIRPSTSHGSGGNGENIILLQDLIEKLGKPGVIILDARSPEDYWEGHIPGAKNVPSDEIFEEDADFLDEVPLDQEVITYCEGVHCPNAEDMAFLLQERGYEDVKVFLGGWEEWTESGMPVEGESG